jgi:predicted pyridoxine 5'-phosphate oxidase superfamily flavin-nucleotide-binding protein
MKHTKPGRRRARGVVASKRADRGAEGDGRKVEVQLARARKQRGREGTRRAFRFLTEIDTAYLATANAGGQPYAQHRGGPKGFIRALNETTLGFADYSGNRQYVTHGNLAENEQAFLFLMDYADRRRIKIWGRARVEHDPELISRLMPKEKTLASLQGFSPGVGA